MTASSAAWSGPDFGFALCCVAIGVALLLRALLDRKINGSGVAGILGVLFIAFAVFTLIVTAEGTPTP